MHAQQFVLDLTPTQLEVAACTSYAYWWYMTIYKRTAATSDCPNDSSVNDEDDLFRQSAAQREARRHYIGCNKDAIKAAASLQRAIELREQYQIDLLRWMDQSSSSVTKDFLNETQQVLLEQYREYVCKEFDKQATAVVGVDEEGRGIVLKLSRTQSEAQVMEYFIFQVYIAERAMAVTEIASRGRQEKLYCLFDFCAYESQHAPSIIQLRYAILDLQALYKERLQQLVILDPPYFLRILFQLASPFLDHVTRQKVILASGMDARQQIVEGTSRTTRISVIFVQRGRIIWFATRDICRQDSLLPVLPSFVWLNGRICIGTGK